MLKLARKSAHLAAEVALSLLALAAVALCVLAIRLGQGPMDITALLHRQHGLATLQGARVSVGRATVALDRFGLSGALLQLAVQDLHASTDDGRLGGTVSHASIGLSVAQLLLGRVRPRGIALDGADLALTLPAPDASAPRPATAPQGSASPPPWLTGLRRLTLHDVRLTVRGAAPGLDLVVSHAGATLAQDSGAGLAGTAQMELQAGGVHSQIAVAVSAGAAGPMVSATTSPISPAALAGLLPALAPLAAADLPVALSGQAALNPDYSPRSGRLMLSAGAGTIHAGRGSVAVASLTATLSVQADAARLDAVRIALAPAGPHGPPPVVNASAAATRQDGRVHATFALAIDGVSLADLPAYWPEGTGGGARSWTVANVTAGRAHDARAAGSLDGPLADLSALDLTALSGGLDADDVSVTWLRPIPGLTHGRAHLVLESPDALTVTMDRGGQSNLVLAPGSSIRITAMSKPHQFGDIAVGLSGPLPDALALLNHPRLHLLDRGGLQVVGAEGAVTCRLTLRIPLEDKVTVDQIPIAADARLTGVHLGRIAAGRDIDDGTVTLRVTNDGLSAAGTGAVSGIAAQLGVTMDFRAGPPGQVLQHVTASGSATPAQLSHAGLPDGAVHLLTGGQAALRVDYAGQRNGTAALQLDADLTQAALTVPIGWTKPVGDPAAIGGRVTLLHGALAGVDHLHAEGPGLAIVSRAQLDGQARTLVLDRLDVGDTRAHGQIGFPGTADGPIRVTLAGPMLDLSTQLDPPAKPAAPATKPAVATPAAGKPATRGQAWAASLAFAQLRLAHGRTLAPFTLDAASDGARILHAHAAAGAPGTLGIDIVPAAGGRNLTAAAADAGAALRALGVADNLAGGRLALDGRYDDTQAGSPLSGSATLADFSVRSAPAIGRLLQALTVYGLTDVLRGPGLHFSKLVAPFVWHDRVLRLASARAFSPSLGLTAQGDVNLLARTVDVTGTVVPAYFFNQLLGDLPLVGRIFSPEKGGGVFAARYSVRGPLGDPKVGVNPLAALTPGFLREGFGLLAPAAAK